MASAALAVEHTPVFEVLGQYKVSPLQVDEDDAGEASGG
jgi:hypothetical protein